MTTTPPATEGRGVEVPAYLSPEPHGGTEVLEPKSVCIMSPPKRREKGSQKLSHAQPPAPASALSPEISRNDESDQSSSESPRRTSNKVWSSFKNLAGLTVSRDSERDCGEQRWSQATPGSDRAGLGKGKGMFRWPSPRRSTEIDEPSAPVWARASVNIRDSTRGGKRITKLQKLELARSASRRIENQHHRVRRIVTDQGGGILRYGALRFSETSGAPTVWSTVASGSPDTTLGAIRWNLWHLARPNLLISVAGLDTGSSTLNARTEGLLLAGLTKAVRTTGAWVLTPGRRDSVGHLVDRLIDGWEDERAPPIVIGLMPWESLDQNIQSELTERPTGTCYTVPARRLNDGLCDGGLCRRHAFLLMHEKRQGDESDSPTTARPSTRTADLGSIIAPPPPPPAVRFGDGGRVGGLNPPEVAKLGKGVSNASSAASSGMSLDGRMNATWSSSLFRIGDWYSHHQARRRGSRDELDSNSGPPSLERGQTVEEIALTAALCEEACANWADTIAFEQHVCKRVAHDGEPTTCAVLLCAGGDVSLLERVLAHLVQGPGAPHGAAGSVIVISDSGGASTDLYHFYVKGHLEPTPPFGKSSSRGSAYGHGSSSYAGAGSPAADQSRSCDSIGSDEVRSPSRIHEIELAIERRNALLVAIRNLALSQSKDRGHDVLSFVSVRDTATRLCERILNGALNSCTLAFDRCARCPPGDPHTPPRELGSMTSHPMCPIIGLSWQCPARSRLGRACPCQGAASARAARSDDPRVPQGPRPCVGARPSALALEERRRCRRHDAARPARGREAAQLPPPLRYVH